MSGVDARHDGFREDLAAYALGALDKRQAVELEQHLDSCERCRSHLEWLRPALDTLPASVEQMEPPPGLRDRLMTAVSAEAKEAQEQPARKHRAGVSGFFLRPAAALATLAVIAAGVGGYALRSGGGANTTTFAAQPQAAEPGMSASLERSGDSGILRVAAMPPLERRQVYQVWLRRGQRLDPSTVFVLRADGTATAPIPDGLGRASEVLVTREPGGGSRRPSTAPMLEVPLTS